MDFETKVAEQIGKLVMALMRLELENAQLKEQLEALNKEEK